jgi:hypothetical protein
LTPRFSADAELFAGNAAAGTAVKMSYRQSW